MTGYLSASEIAARAGLTKRSVNMRASDESWPFIEQATQGGTRRLYKVADLPAEIQKRIQASDVSVQASELNPDACGLNPAGSIISPFENGPLAKRAKSGEPTTAPGAPVSPDAGTETPNSVPAIFSESTPNSGTPCGMVSPNLDANLDRAPLARADLVRVYIAAIAAAAYRDKVKARNLFIQGYNSGALYKDIFDTLGEVSWQTLERWKSRRDGDATALQDRRGRGLRRGCGISDEQQKIVIACLCHPNKLFFSEAIHIAKMIMRQRGIEDGHSDSTYYRFIKDWIKVNYDQFVFYREGQHACDEKVYPYIERDYNKIEVGDILVADGHTLNFETINPWTGKPKRMTLILWHDMKSNYPLGWEIMPSENTTAISSALRRAIIRLGKFPKVAYLDNGKAFSSRYFNGQDFSQSGIAGLFERLGIKTIFAWPYHAQSKTIERFFGSFSFIERLAPSYSGTSIEKKPPRLNRGEKIHRAIWEKLTGGRALTLEESHALIAWGFDEYVNRTCRGGHLKGLRPAQVFEAGKGPGVDRASLNYLMLTATDRTINQNGVSLFGRNYWAPELYGRNHAVTVRYDLEDSESVLVYESTGEFICEARVNPKVHPAAFALGTKADQAELERQIKTKKSLEKQTTSSARAFLKNEIMPTITEQMKRIGIGGPDIPVGPDRPLSGRGAGMPRLPAISPAEVAAEAAELIELNAAARVEDEARFWKSLDEMPDADRYEELLRLEAGGTLALPDDAATFMRWFESSASYEDNREYWERLSLNLKMNGSRPKAEVIILTPDA